MKKNKKIMKIALDKYQVLFSKKMIAKRIEELANMIKIDYATAKKPPILLFVLTGGLYFGTDLSKALDKIGCLHHIDTVGLKRYTQDEQGGAVELVSKPHANLGGRKLIIVEDVVDNGATMNFLDAYLKALPVPPKSIEYCILGLKTNHGPLKFQIKYLCFNNLGPEWIVGYGLDSNQGLRGLEDIWVKIN